MFNRHVPPPILASSPRKLLFPRLFCTFNLAILGALAAQSATAQTKRVPPALPSKPSIATATPAPTSSPASSKEEMRGMWVVRDSLKSPASVHQVIVTAQKYHLNAIFVQVRGRGDAWYSSNLEPRAEMLAGQPASFDPLEQMVREGHKAGLKVHAWMNTFLTWSGSKSPSSEMHLWNSHRDWFAHDENGKCSCIPTTKTEGAFLSPSNPEVQNHLFNVFTDVASRYDVDGIHFDYCRYAGANVDFSQGALDRFRGSLVGTLTEDQIAQFDGRRQSDSRIYVHAFGKQWADWRRMQITNLVTRISQAVKTNKPWMEVSAAVFPDSNEAFNDKGQDWRGWIQSGVLDAVVLMAYDKNTDKIVKQTQEALSFAGDRHVYIGLGAWRLPAGDVAHKIAEVRKTGAAGVNLFSYDGVHTKPQYLNTLSRTVFASRSASPRMRWLPDRSGKRAPAPRETGSPAKPELNSDGEPRIEIRLNGDHKDN